MNQLEIFFGSPLRLVVEQAPPASEVLYPVWTFQVGDFIFTGANMPAGQAVPQSTSATMQAGTRATVSVEWKDSGGRTVKVDGPTAWVSSSPEIVQVEVATGNPQIANLLAPGPVGESSIQATADADLGEGVRSVTATIKITVIAGEAVGGEITFSQSPAQGTPQGARR